MAGHYLLQYKLGPLKWNHWISRAWYKKIITDNYGGANINWVKSSNPKSALQKKFGCICLLVFVLLLQIYGDIQCWEDIINPRLPHHRCQRSWHEPIQALAFMRRVMVVLLCLSHERGLEVVQKTQHYNVDCVVTWTVTAAHIVKCVIREKWHYITWLILNEHLLVCSTTVLMFVCSYSLVAVHLMVGLCGSYWLNTYNKD